MYAHLISSQQKQFESWSKELYINNSMIQFSVFDVLQTRSCKNGATCEPHVRDKEPFGTNTFMDTL